MNESQSKHEPIPVLYRDDDLVIVSKPSGLAVHRGWARDSVTLLSQLKRQLGLRLHPVHRLDRGTSGALLLAVHAEAARVLQEALQAPDAAKVYLALVRGIAPDNGYIDHAIAKSKQHEKREAYTAFERLATFERYSLVRARPYTGRLHQVRRHLKFISLPLIGDTRYGKGEHNRLYRERFDAHRLVLHAAQLRLRPRANEPLLSLRATLPEELERLFARIGVLEAARAAVAGPIWDPDVSGFQRFEDAPTPGQATTA